MAQATQTAYDEVILRMAWFIHGRDSCLLESHFLTIDTELDNKLNFLSNYAVVHNFDQKKTIILRCSQYIPRHSIFASIHIQIYEAQVILLYVLYTFSSRNIAEYLRKLGVSWSGLFDLHGTLKIGPSLPMKSMRKQKLFQSNCM